MTLISLSQTENIGTATKVRGVQFFELYASRDENKTIESTDDDVEIKTLFG